MCVCTWLEETHVAAACKRLAGARQEAGPALGIKPHAAELQRASASAATAVTRGGAILLGAHPCVVWMDLR